MIVLAWLVIDLRSTETNTYARPGQPGISKEAQENEGTRGRTRVQRRLDVLREFQSVKMIDQPANSRLLCSMRVEGVYESGRNLETMKCF